MSIKSKHRCIYHFVILLWMKTPSPLLERRCLASISKYLTNTPNAEIYLLLSCPEMTIIFGSTPNVISHLQWIQNIAVCVFVCMLMSSNTTTHLASIHWLPVKVSSTYIIGCLCYHCHSSTAPSYVTDMLQKTPFHSTSF